MKKTKVIICIVSAVALVLIASIVTATIVSNAQKRNDPNGAFDDKKKDGRTVTVSESGIVEKAVYSHTENTKNAEVEARADAYGTFDVYTGESGTDYFFLYNTDTICGFLNYKYSVTEKPIEKDAAAAIADGYLREKRAGQGEYKLTKSYVQPLSGGEGVDYYAFIYSYFVSGYKTDDQFRVWVNAEGGIKSYAEFNYGRYAGMKVEENAYNDAKKWIDSALAGGNGEFEVLDVDYYLRYDDNGDVELVADFTMSFPDHNQRESVSRKL